MARSKECRSERRWWTNDRGAVLPNPLADGDAVADVVRESDEEEDDVDQALPVLVVEGSNGCFGQDSSLQRKI